MAALPQITTFVNQAAPAPAKNSAVIADKQDTPQDFLQQLMAALSGDSQLAALNDKGSALLKKVQNLATPHKDNQDLKLSDAETAKLAALLQQFPNLQQLMSGQLLAGDVSAALAALSKGNTLSADLTAKFDPAVLKDLEKFAATDAAQTQGFKDLLGKMTATNDPSLLVTLNDKVKQLLAKSADQAAPVAHDDGTNTADVSENPVAATTARLPQADNDANVSLTPVKDPGIMYMTRVAGHLRAPHAIEAAGDIPAPEKILNLTEVSNAVVEQPAIAVAAVSDDKFNPLLTSDNKNLDTMPMQLISQTLPTNNTNITTEKLDAYLAQQARTATPVHPASVMVSVQMQKLALSGHNQTMLIQLQPQELGRIEVRLRFDGGRIKAHIAADKADTLELMQKDGDALTTALQSAGLDTNADTLSFSLRDGGQSPQQNNHKSAAHNDAFGTMLATSNTDTVTRTFAMLPHGTTNDGRVDVKI